MKNNIINEEISINNNVIANLQKELKLIEKKEIIGLLLDIGIILNLVRILLFNLNDPNLVLYFCILAVVKVTGVCMMGSSIANEIKSSKIAKKIIELTTLNKELQQTLSEDKKKFKQNTVEFSSNGKLRVIKLPFNENKMVINESCREEDSKVLRLTKRR